MDNEKILSVFKREKAILDGHFRLSSGLHSPHYLQCALILQYPELAAEFSREIVRKFRGQEIFREVMVNAVVSPALGGITFGYEVARNLQCRAIFTERELDVTDNVRKMKLRRGFTIIPGENVVVAEDVITTGGSTQEVIDVVHKNNGLVVAILSLVDRSTELVNFNVPYFSLLKVNFVTYPSDCCPLCQQNIPVIKPGSRI